MLFKNIVTSLKDKDQWTFVNENGKRCFQATKFIEYFKNSLNVNTLRTHLFQGKPIMYMYKDGMFVNGVSALFKECIYSIMGISISTKKIGEYLSFLCSQSYVDDDYFDTINPNFINLKNGVYDIKKRELFEHHPKYKFRTMININYNPDADYKFMDEFVSQITKERASVQELFGNCLYRDYIIQKAALLHGKGANGKDTLLYCLEQMLGKEKYSAVNLITITNDKFSLSSLYKKYANISTETPDKKLASTEVFKALRGGSPIYAQYKFGHPFNFVNYATLIFSCNKIPISMDNSYAFWRSWLLVEFPHQFNGNEANKKLKYELTTPERMEAILNWAIDGLHRLLGNMDFSSTLDVDEIEYIWIKSSNNVETFVKECIIEGDKTYNEDLIPAYIKYCDSNKLTALSQQAFYKEFKKQMGSQYPMAVDISQDTANRRFRRGIELKGVD